MEKKVKRIKVASKFNPRNNFPYISSAKRGESNFVSSFANTYLNMLKESKPHFKFVAVKELNISGYGIADFVCLYYRKNTISKNPRKSLIAFEMKLKDWKKALFQAYRYKYFANQAVAILPYETFKLTPSHIIIFRRVQVGLWLYDTKTKLLRKIYTPRYTIPISENINLKTVISLSKIVKN